MVDSQENSVLPQKLLPQVTLHRVLGIFTLSIVAAWLVRLASQGHAWAFALVVTCAAVFGFLLLYSGVFMLIWIPARASRGADFERPTGKVPDDQLPPQVVRPDTRGDVS